MEDRKDLIQRLILSPDNLEKTISNLRLAKLSIEGKAKYNVSEFSDYDKEHYKGLMGKPEFVFKDEENFAKEFAKFLLMMLKIQTKRTEYDLVVLKQNDHDYDKRITSFLHKAIEKKLKEAEGLIECIQEDNNIELGYHEEKRVRSAVKDIRKFYRDN